ncbi:platelet glycoprotein Ib alpha chain isoform X2 [Bufo bufo]|uniref:platelet glycoprotein Ib alpha chain isoform X2 n=1 Tax=Bufo bufo TaxID=8384 RepID=UPI001ABE0936|nr:platelet glycoprotein Ib alpha chain isoform X2 [Bufo bufo]
MISFRRKRVKITKWQKKTEQWWTSRRAASVRGYRFPSRLIMNFLLHFGLLNVIVVCKVFSAPSCSTEKNFSKNKEETSCINLGLSILPLNDIPKNTAILILSSNNLKSLSTSSFNGLKELTELDASDNGMTSFEIDLALNLEELHLANNTLKTLPMVSQLPQLTTLQLSNNHITTIPENAFMGLKKLTRLELQHNYIDSLDEQVFEGLRSLKHLDLSYNQLLFLPDRLLAGVEDLEIFYLSWNRLTHIPKDFFENLELNYVYLDNNPWNCNCALKDFKNWLEINEDIVYKISKAGPTKNPKGVICSHGPPLIDYDMNHCNGKGDVDIYSVPIYTKSFVTIWTNTPLLTDKPTTELRVTKWWPTSTPTEGGIDSLPVTEATTTLRTTKPTTNETTTSTTTTPTTEKTTTLRTTTPTTEATTTLRTTTPTTEATTTLRTTTPTTKETTTLKTTTPTTNPITYISTSTTGYFKSSPKTRVKSTTTPYPITSMMVTTKVEITTDIASTSKEPTSEESVKVSTVSPTEEPTEIPINTMLPARSLRPAAFGMDWLVMVILKHCCLLHVIIYGLCIFLLLVGIIITTMCLLWIYCCNQDFHQWPPGIRLIRYSIRAPMSDEDILLVNNGAIESHFRDQSLAGVTKMLVLESDPQQQEIRYTSAIL